MKTKKDTDSRYLLKKRYIVDYKTVRKLGPDGKLHSEMVYAGDDYYYKTPEVVRFCAGRLLLASIIAIVAFVAVFCFRNMELLAGYFVGVPFVLMGFSLWWNTRGAWIAFKKKPPLERRQADCVGDKLHMSAWFGLFASGISAIASVVYVIRDEQISFDIAVTLALVALELAYSIFVFSRRKVFKTEVRKENGEN